MERKYLLKLEGRPTRNIEVFTSEELDALYEAFIDSIAFNVTNCHGSSDSFFNVTLRKLANVLKYTKPSD